jgi:hypothetical protein
MPSTARRPVTSTPWPATAAAGRAGERRHHISELPASLFLLLMATRAIAAAAIVVLVRNSASDEQEIAAGVILRFDRPVSGYLPEAVNSRNIANPR